MEGYPELTVLKIVVVDVINYTNCNLGASQYYYFLNIKNHLNINCVIR